MLNQKLKRIEVKTLEKQIEIFTFGNERPVRRRRGRILLGDNTDGEAVMLWPIRFMFA
jgi:hypothetical protein